VTTIADCVKTKSDESLRSAVLNFSATGLSLVTALRKRLDPRWDSDHKLKVAGIAELRNNNVVKSAAPTEDLRTRDQVARTILESGPSTAVDLAERLGLTPAGIRRHLDSLVLEGILEEREPHLRSTRGRGRPSKVFVMSDTGRERFEHSYDDLAVSALKYIAANSGEHLVTGFARHRAEEIVRRSHDRVSKSKNSITGLAEFLSEEGYAANTHAHGIGIELCQHHCPIAHVAAEFPQLCEEETAAFSKILGTHVQRLATIAHGDGVCTTFIPTNSLTPTQKPQFNKPHKKRKLSTR
jgi:predicted ArsR family transcriptional regulator